MNLRPHSLLFSLLSLFALAGCHKAHVVDDVDLELDFAPLHPDALHVPYVKGAKMTLLAVSDMRDDSTAGWRLASDDPSILRIDSQSDGSASCTAVGVGTVIVRVYESATATHPIDTARIEVRAPTQARAFAHGPLIVDQGESGADTGLEARIVVGGTGTYLVQYYDGSQRLYGNGVLTTTDPAAGVTSSVKQTFLFENRDWLFVTPTSAGELDVALFADGTQLAPLHVIGTPASAVDHVELIGMNERGHKDGDMLAVLAQAYDAVGNPIDGVEYTWDLGGVGEPGLGDLYRYALRTKVPQMLGATFDGLEAHTLIHATDGYVDSTKHVGCSAVPAADAGASALFGVVLALASRARRRRRELRR